MSKTDAPKCVTALFSFKGKNNDELCFKKGDTITITQMDEEGWWEGTLHDKTGWFPSNYVKECRPPESNVSTVKTSPEKAVQESPVHHKLNRDIVLKDIVDSERVNVAELQGLINSFLHPLDAANILSKEEYRQLLGNVQEILEVHQRLLSSLESGMTQGCGSRVGNLFLTLAGKLKTIHTTYCGNHPRAVCILDRYRDELNDFMERSGAISPGILVLTTGLSKPFRRLDKYSAMLQELERYTEKNHPDRGDTQRSVAVYREITDRCASIRKQRELALQVLTSGIKGWEGEELSSLGEILYVGPVALATGTTGQDRRDRYFVLFPTTLLVLSASPRMSSFVYEGKLPLTGITITQTQDTDEIKHAFAITGPMIESILVFCTNKEDQQRWIELLVQEQTTNNSVVKSPTTSRVSYNLPPYARLSRYFARLVKKKIIRPEVLKKLLYLQYVLKPDMSNVKMRRTNVTTYALYPIESKNSEARCSNESQVTSFDETNKVKTEEPTDETATTTTTTTRRKSTLTLEVKYVVGDIDLSTVGLARDSSLSEAVSTENSIREISKSLPAMSDVNNVASFIDNSNVNDDSVATGSSICRLRFTELPSPVGISHGKLYRRKEQLGIPVSFNRWKSIGFVREQQAVADSVNNPIAIDVQFQTSIREEIDFDFDANAASVGSSDSGMVESYRLNSSEIRSSCKWYMCVGNRHYTENAVKRSSDESENDENSFEHQCVCTSPFDSTPRDSADTSKHADSILRSSPNETETQQNTTQRRFTQPIPYAHQTVIRKVGRKTTQRDQPAVENNYGGTKQIYTSGLYAHWWLKKSIPLSGYSNQGKLPWHGCFIPLFFR